MKKMNERKKNPGKFLMCLFIMALIVFGATAVSAASQDGVTVQFRDGNGNPAAGIPDMVIEEGETIVLPDVPAEKKRAVQGTPSWKTTLHVSEETQYFEPGEEMSCETAKDWIAEQGGGNVLTLYGTKVCTFRYFTNDGSKQIGEDFSAYEGTEIKFYGSPDPDNELYRGWSKYKKGTGVWAGFGRSYIMDEDRSLYLVEYAKMTFKDSNGSTNSTYKKMDKIVKKGSEFALPCVPQISNYKNKGWALTKNASSAVYGSRTKVTVKESETFYAARQYLPYAVTFNNNTGTSKDNAFKDLYVRAGKNEYITLPKVPEQKGYTALGWATKTKQTKAQYKEGQKVKITKKTKFYAVYRKAKKCKVVFCKSDGSSDSSYTALNKSVTEKSTITLPAVPSRKGYVNDGWLLKTSQKTQHYDEGDKVKVYGNCKFYAVQEQAASVVLHKTRGAEYKTIYVKKGDSFTLPGAENPEGYTFMGWSTKPNVVITGSKPGKVQYETGEVIPSVNSTIHLYQVMYQRSTEKNLISSQMAKPDLNRYGGIVMVGDSRTVRMRQALAAQNCGANMKGVRFVGASGQGIKWFRDEGYRLLINQIKHIRVSSSKPVAVVFNLGVNDLYRISDYVAFMNEIAPELEKMNCKLYYMSVNPINGVMIEKTGRLSLRKEADVRAFNDRIKTGLDDYTYIDTYSWLMKNGFGTSNGVNGKDSSEDDGLHYTVKTYKRIYDYCLRYINAH